MIVSYDKHSIWVILEAKSSSMPIMARSDLIKEQPSTGEERWLEKAGLGKRWRGLRVYNTGASSNWCIGARDRISCGLITGRECLPAAVTLEETLK
jgi:hypothetical protein